MLQLLRASREAKQANRTETIEEGRASELRRSPRWGAMTRLVNAAHHLSRGPAKGGSGKKAGDLLPRGTAEKRTTYVLARPRVPVWSVVGAEPKDSASQSSVNDAVPPPASSQATFAPPEDGWELDIDAEIEVERMEAEGESGEDGPPGAPSPPGSSPAHTPRRPAGTSHVLCRPCRRRHPRPEQRAGMRCFVLTARRVMRMKRLA